MRTHTDHLVLGPFMLDKAEQSEWKEATGRFGLTVGLAFLVLAAVARWRGYAVSWTVFVALGVAALTSGVLLPSRLGPVERAWMRVALLVS